MQTHAYYVYMLRCSDDSYYTGVSRSYEKRLREHNEGKDPQSYTFRRRPVEIVYTAMFEDVFEAIHWEKVVKGWSRKKKEALIRGDQEALKFFAKRKGAQENILKKHGSMSP